jgi:hypothetical protein
VPGTSGSIGVTGLPRSADELSWKPITELRGFASKGACNMEEDLRAPALLSDHMCQWHSHNCQRCTGDAEDIQEHSIYLGMITHFATVIQSLCVAHLDEAEQVLWHELAIDVQVGLEEPVARVL